MNNRRKQLMLASAKEYCKCVVEGKTLKYNNVANPSNGTISTWANISTFTAISGHKYAICINVSREPNDYNDTDYQVYVVGFGTTYYGITQFKALIVTSDTSGTIEVASAVYDNFGGNVDFNLMVVDITALDLDVDNENDFFATDLGKYIAKGNYLPYEPNGKFIHAQSPINFKGRNMLSLNRTQGTLSGFSNSNPRLFQSNNYYLGLSANNYYTGANAILDFEKTNTSVKFKTTNTGYGMALPILVKPNKTYRVSFDSDNDNTYRIGWYDENGNFIDFDLNYTGIFNSPKKAYWGVIVLAPSNTNITTYSNIIFCENALYQNKYEPYCNNSVFESGLTLYKGDTYKTYSVDSVEYNQFCIVPTLASQTINGIIFSNNGNGTITISGTATADTTIDLIGNQQQNIPLGHKVFITNFANPSYNTYFLYDAYESNITSSLVGTPNGYVKSKEGSSTTISPRIRISNGTNVPLQTLRIMLIDLTALGLTNVNNMEDFNKTKLGMFLSKGYYLSYTTTTKTIKDQIVRTFKEVDLSSLTWYYESHDMVWYATLPSGCKINDNEEESGNIIAEKYKTSAFENREDKTICIGELGWLVSGGSCIFVFDSNYNSPTQPSGKALIELETPRISVWKVVDVVDYNEFVATEYTDIWKLNRDYSEYEPINVTADIGIKRANLNRLDDEGENNDYCLQDNYIYVKTDDIQNAWVFELLCSSLPTRMVSRRIINVESENEIDLDFTKE